MGSCEVSLKLVLEPSFRTQKLLQTQTCCARQTEWTGISFEDLQLSFLLRD